MVQSRPSMALFSAIRIFFGADGDKRNIFLNQVLQLFIYDKPFVLIDFLHAKRYVGNNTGLAIGACLGGLIASISFPLTYAVTSMSTFALQCSCSSS